MTTGGNGTSISYQIPVTDGNSLETIFTNGGNAADECFYEVYDSQNTLLVTQGFPGSVPGNFSTPVTCPATATYNYSWQNITSGGVSGLNNPNIQNPLATVAVVTQFEVTAYDSLNPQCIAIDTVIVQPNANPISATLTGNTAICTGDPLILNFVLVGGAPYDVDLLITASGQSLNEAVILVVPVIPIAINESQIKNRDYWLNKLNLSVKCSYMNIDFDKKIKLSLIKNLNTNLPLDERVFLANGSSRVANKLMKLYNNYIA
jgi:hypothetical protein